MSRRPELSYFGLQAYIGTTKHLGGQEANKELIERCHRGYAVVVGHKPL